MKRSNLILAAVVATAFAAAPVAFAKTRTETVVSGERERISSHARWERDGGRCVGEAVPVLELVTPAEHGKVEFAVRDRKPGECDQKLAHAVVYYTSEAKYTGADSFHYLRIDPETGRRQGITVVLEVRKPGNWIQRIFR